MKLLLHAVPDGYLEAATYLRKSVVRDDKEAESIGVQRRANNSHGEVRKWTITREYCDEGRSGADPNRPDWLQLIDDIRAGKVKRLIVREQARLVRDDFELLLFLRLMGEFKIEVFDSYGRQILNNPETKIRGIFDADYREQISKAVSKTRSDKASRGLPPPTPNRPYGYTHNYAKVIPAEAKVCKEMAKRYLSGESMYAIAKDLNERGIYKYTGKTWKAPDISRILRRPESAAIRTYKPKGALKAEEVAVGEWPCLWNKDQKLAEQYYRKLMVRLESTDPWTRDTARKHLLVGIVYCGICNTALSCKDPSYWCSPTRGGCGKIVRNKTALDNYFKRRVYEELLAMPDVEAESDDDPLGDELARLQVELDDTLEARKTGELTLREYISLKTPLEAQIATLTRQQASRVSLPVADAQAFLAADTAKQRAVIKRLYPAVGVLPTGRKGLRFNPDQLKFD